MLDSERAGFFFGVVFMSVKSKQNGTKHLHTCADYYKVFSCLPYMLMIHEPRHEKTNVLVSDLVRHKPGGTATEDG